MEKSDNRLTPDQGQVLHRIDAENRYDAIETAPELRNESASRHPAPTGSLMSVLEKLEPVVEDFPTISDSPPDPVEL